MLISNEKLLEEITNLSKKIDEINYTLHGNGAIGLIDQTKENAKSVKKIEKKTALIVYTATGIMLAISVMSEFIDFLKR